MRQLIPVSRLMKQLILIIALILPTTTFAKEKRISKNTASVILLFCPFCVLEVAKRMEDPKKEDSNQKPIKRVLASTKK